MHHFQVQDRTLYCENCKVSDIIKETGTPAYIYSSATITHHFRQLQEAFSEQPARICYSVKANSNIHILSLLQKMGAGADIVSGGELFRALKAGIPAENIVYSGAGKTEAEIEYALESGVYMINAESVPELYLISKIAEKRGKTVQISIRVNPDVDAKTHRHTTTAKKENKFGLSVERIEEHYRIASELPNLEIHGIDVHLGSPILTLDPYLKALDILSEALNKLKKGGIHPKVLDLGGGLGIVYKNEQAFTAKDFAQAVLPKVKQMGLELILEPGRFIVGNAGILVAAVTYVKETPAKKFLITDAGMNDLIRPPLYDGYHEIIPVDDTGTPLEKVDIVGPICESADFLAKDRLVPQQKQGDLLAVMSAGAYGFSMASNYNSRPRACEILVDNDTWKIIRKRETYEDLIEPEKI